tara:strand:- start:584 stop:742 length:159 start_codon:yes stop_codon:yes gene_type:complete
MSNQRMSMNTPSTSSTEPNEGFLGGMNFDPQLLTAIGIVIFSLMKPKNGRWF